MTAQPGTYALILKNRKTSPLRVGKLGTLGLKPGYYVYVGSAFGAGGLAARIRHHRQIAICPHWHIDYLRAACELIEVWVTTGKSRREHAWATAVAGLPGAELPMRRFGSSDCACETHLFRFQYLPTADQFRKCIRTKVSVHR
jgi:Uri superfamily endonuclease